MGRVGVWYGLSVVPISSALRRKIAKPGGITPQDLIGESQPIRLEPPALGTFSESCVTDYLHKDPEIMARLARFEGAQAPKNAQV